MASTAGAPLGNNNAFKGKRWADAVERALEAWPDKTQSKNNNDLMKGMNAAAYEFVKCMMEKKELSWFKEVGDRLDGKAVQPIDAKVTTHELTIDDLK